MTICRFESSEKRASRVVLSSSPSEMEIHGKISFPDTFEAFVGRHRSHLPEKREFGSGRTPKRSQDNHNLLGRVANNDRSSEPVIATWGESKTSVFYLFRGGREDDIQGRPDRLGESGMSKGDPEREKRVRAGCCG